MASFISGLSEAQQIELMYIAYFGRAGDGGGYQFWTNSYDTYVAAKVPVETALIQIASDFVPQKETLALYPFLNSPFNPKDPVDQANLSAFIDSVYHNLFNRAPDDAGKAYWTNQILSGAFSVGKAVYVIANAAGTSGDPLSATDAAILKNKIDAGLDFTVRTSAAGQGAAPLSDAYMAAAKEVINGVDATAASLTAAKQETTDYLNSKPPVTLVFTAGVDNLVGGAGDDIINGDDSAGTKTVQATDKVDGGAGVDTLHLYGAAAVPMISNVENVVLHSFVPPGGNFSAATGLATLTLDGITGAVTVATDTAVKIANTSGGAVTVNHLAVDTAANIDLAGLNGTNVTVNGGGLTSATFTSSAANPISGTNTVGTIATPSSKVAVNFAGATDLSVNGALANASVTNTMTGKLNVSINTAGGDTSYVGSDKGADNVTISVGTLSATDKVSGGADANDSISLFANGTVVKGISGFETMTLLNDGVASVLDMSDMNANNALANVIVKDNKIQLTKVDADAVNGVVLDSGAGSSHIIDFAGQANGGFDAASVTLKDTSGTLNIVNVDQLTLTSSGTGPNVEFLTATDMNQLTLKGDAALSLSLGPAFGLDTVDASALTKGVNLNLSGVGATMVPIKIIQTAQADTIILGGPTANTVVFKAAGDSKAGAIDVIQAFSTAIDDKLDFTALGVTKANANLYANANYTADGSVTAANATNFFDNGVVHNVAYTTNGTDTYVYVDANHTGSFEAGADMVIKLAGLNGANLVANENLA